MRRHLGCVLGLVACGGDAGLTAPGGTEPPLAVPVQPEPGSTVFAGDPLLVEVTVSDADGPTEDLTVVWASSVDGVLDGTTVSEGAARSITTTVPEGVGAVELVVLVRDARGGASRARIPIYVIDPDVDGDGHRAIAHGGDDCDDQNPQLHPDVAEVCDGFDQDCDGEVDEGLAWQTWYRDADADGVGDPWISTEACAQPAGFVATDTDCHDDQPERSHCVDCADIRDSLWDRGDGLYTIDPVGGEPFEVACDMTHDEGGWTLIGVTTWLDEDWHHLNMMDTSSFGPAGALDTGHKSPGFSHVAVESLRFDNGEMSATYDVGEGVAHASMWAFLHDVPMHNCGEDDGYAWPMVAGNLDHPSLCSTELYVNVRDTEGDPCTDHWIPQNVSATGPAWSMVFNGSCPHDDSMESAWIGNGTNNYTEDGSPWTAERPLRMWVRGVAP